MFKFEDGKIVSESGHKFNDFALLIDLDGYVLLCCGDVKTVSAKHMVLVQAERAFGSGMQPALIVPDVINEKFCEELNHMFDCTSYVEIWCKEHIECKGGST